MSINVVFVQREQSGARGYAGCRQAKAWKLLEGHPHSLVVERSCLLFDKPIRQASLQINQKMVVFVQFTRLLIGKTCGGRQAGKHSFVFRRAAFVQNKVVLTRSIC
jgi:hypothetical protein